MDKQPEEMTEEELLAKKGPPLYVTTLSSKKLYFYPDEIYKQVADKKEIVKIHG